MCKFLIHDDIVSLLVNICETFKLNGTSKEEIKRIFMKFIDKAYKDKIPVQNMKDFKKGGNDGIYYS